MKREYKRVLSVVLAVLLLLGSMPMTGIADVLAIHASAATRVTNSNGYLLQAEKVFANTGSGSCGENANWELQNGVLTISGTGEMADYSFDAGTPWDSFSLAVDRIVINNGITKIGECAFAYCENANYVTLPASLTKIGKNAFSRCKSITNISIPEQVTSIDSYAFSNCESISQITIPKNITTIGENVFWYCTGLSSIDVNSDNTAFSSEDGILFNKQQTKILCFPINKPLTEYKIPDSVTSIGTGAFAGCHGLERIQIPGSVQYLAEMAFYYCESLREIKIPYGIRQLSSSVFDGCSSLEHISIPDSVCWVYAAAFRCCKALKEIVLPEGVSYIGALAFYSCDSLQYVHIPQSVTEIRERIIEKSPAYLCSDSTDCYAFEYAEQNGLVFQKCEGHPIENEPDSYGIFEYTIDLYTNNATIIGLNDSFTGGAVTIPSKIDGYNVSSIGESAFAERSDITKVTLPDGIAIGEKAFCYCTGLTEVINLEDAASIGDMAFFLCESLNAVTVSPRQIGEYVFALCSSLETVEIEAIDMSEDPSLGVGMFAASAVTEITIPSCVSSVENGMFLGCPYLEDVVIEDGCTTVGNASFALCTNLQSVSVPQSVRSIGAYAFWGCFSLPEMDLSGVQVIGQSAFAYDFSLETVVFGDYLYNILAKAFIYVPLESLYLPASVRFDVNAFTDCLRTVNGTDTLSSIMSTESLSFYDEMLQRIHDTPEAINNTNIVYSSAMSLEGLCYDAMSGIMLIALNSGCFDSLDDIDIKKTLTSINVDDRNPYYKSVDGVLFSKDGQELLMYPGAKDQTTYTVPQETKTIHCLNGENGNFVSPLEQIILPDGVETIDVVFTGSESLQYIHIPSSVTTIKDGLLTGTSAYICSDNESCYAKTYSDANNIEFRVCAGHTSTLSGNCGKYGDNVKWTLNLGTGTLTISGTGEMEDYEIVGDWYSNSPWDAYVDVISSVLICDGVSNIGNYSFESCDNLVEVTIPNSVTHIGDFAFDNCSGLSSVTIPNSVTNIGSGAFWGTGLLNVEIPNGVKTIGGFAFDNCWNLESVNIPASVVQIGGSAFGSCITAITVDADNAFYSSDEKGVLYNKDKTTLIQYPAGNLREEFSVPNGVTIISSSAFNYCDHLTSIEIPSSVSSMEQYPFYGCTSLIAFAVDKNNACFSSDVYGVLYNKDQTTLLQYPIGNAQTSFLVPNSVNKIANYAFYGSSGLTSVHIPSSVIEIGESHEEDYVFHSCTNLDFICSDNESCYAKTYADANGIEFRVCAGHADETEERTYGIFRYLANTADNTACILSLCSDYSGETVQIPETIEGYTVTQIANNAFYERMHLRTVTIPNTVTRIGEQAFARTGITEIVVPDSVTEIGASAFMGCEYLERAVLGDGLTVVAENMFYACVRLTDVSLGDRIEEIRTNAFSSCETLQSVVLPDSLRTIGSGAFSMAALRSIMIPRQVTTIGSQALLCADIHLHEMLYFDTLLTALRNPETMSDLFDELEQHLEEVTVAVRILASGAAEITEEQVAAVFSAGTFTSLFDLLGWDYDPERLNDNDYLYLLVQNKLNEVLQTQIYSTCSTLCRIDVDAANELFISKDGVLFSKDGKTLLQYPGARESDTYTVPDGTERIRSLAFALCKNLSHVVLPDSVQTLEAQVFVYCARLNDIHIPSGVTEIGNNAVASCDDLAFICSDKEDCCVKTYADANGIEFRVCQDHTGHKHVYDILVTAPTCLEDGYTTYTCSVCGESHIKEWVEALGHDFDDSIAENVTIVEPTETKPGSKTVRCARCGQEKVTLLPATKQPSIIVSGETVRAGQTVEVTVSLQNNPGVIAMQMELQYDTSVLTLTQVDWNGFFVNGDCTLCGRLNAVPFTILWEDPLAVEDHAEDGVVLTLTFFVAQDAQPGSTAIRLTCDTESTFNTQMQDVVFAVQNGSVTVTDRVAGDANADGMVDLKDIVLIRRFLVGGWDAQIDVRNADVNADGAVNLKDTVMIARYLAGGWDIELL